MFTNRESPASSEDILLLTDMVRNQYCRFLEQKLKDNVRAWTNQGVEQSEALELISKCVILLEDKALKACMMAKLYQRVMVELIADVRRCTDESRLVNQLEEMLQMQHSNNHHTKATQTENVQQLDVKTPTVCQNVREVDTEYSLSLQQKMRMFHRQLNKHASAEELRNYTRIEDFEQRRQYIKQKKKRLSSTKPAQASMSPLTDSSMSNRATKTKTVSSVVAAETSINDDDDDEIGRELAEIFCEEKTELDDILGIDPNKDDDDPHINSILKEIANAKLTQSFEGRCNEPPQKQHQQNLPVLNTVVLPSSKNIRNSLWPCELFHQRQKLQSSLNRLIEEDFRWHELIKWKFTSLFGEDSDDEFATYSPTIELDEVLITSCIHRISPWTVKYLMRPMKDGLIANRFLFKKLAKKLAHSIIIVNQYPDERMVKQTVEDFFCLHQAVMSIEDLEKMPSIEG